MASRITRISLAATLMSSVAALAAGAQVAPTEPPACLGFSFGAWTPPLDWRGAGHGDKVDSSRVAHAPGGRDWAVNEAGAAEDSVVLLFPRWWPVGVVVELPTRNPAFGDTIIGRARALIANGQGTSPTSRVRAWRVLCGRTPER